VVAIVFYAALWAIALDGASGLIPLLALPPILAAIIVLGVALHRYMGLPARPPKFHQPEDEEES